MENLEKSLNDFFTYTVSFIKDWSVCISGSKHFLKPLKNLSEQLESIHSCTWDEALVKKFPDIKERLVHKIHFGLEEESVRLNETWCRLSSLKNELLSKLDSIERNVRDHCLATFSSHGITVPPVYTLIEYAEDIVRHYSTLFIELTTAVNLMNFKDQKSILSLEKVFQKSSVVPDNVKDILSSTKDLINVPFSLGQLGSCGGLQILFLDAICKKIFDNDNEIEDEDIQVLYELFDQTLLKALDIIDKEWIELITIADTDRTYFSVQGEKRFYTIYPHINFCQCYMYKASVLKKQKYVMCKHVLACHLALVSENYKTRNTAKLIYTKI